MAISYIASGTGITSVSSMPSHTAGDYLIACAFRDGNNTAPTLPSGWTELPSGSSLGAGSNSNGMRLGYKVAAGSSEASGTWTSATSLNIDVYRGVGSVGNVTQNEGSGTAINYPANTFTVTDGTSWGVLYGAHRSANTDIEVPPGSATLRSDNADATDELATHDTNGGVTGWSSTNQTLTGTSSGWRTVVVELVAASSAVTGTITQTLPKLAQSATASRAFHATVAQTLPRLAQSVTASRAFHATVAQTLPKLAQAVSASLTFSATAAQTLPKLAQAATALLTFTASAAQTLPKLAQAVAASLTFTGTAAQTLPKLAQEATADVAISGFAGSIAQTLPSLQQAASASLTFTATVAQTLPRLTQAAVATAASTAIDYGESRYVLRRARKKKRIKRAITAVAERLEAPTVAEIERALSDILISVDNVEKNTKYQESINALIRAEVEKKQKEVERAFKERQEQAAWLREFTAEQERLAAEEAQIAKENAEFAALVAATNRAYKNARNKKRTLMIAALIDTL